MVLYARTGIEGVDAMLEGQGIPRGYVILVLGSPGCGKTTFGIQFLYNGVVKFGENGILVLLEEDPEMVKSNMRRFGWDLNKLESEDKIAIIDASPIRFITKNVKLGEVTIGSREFQLISLVERIKKECERIDAKRLVIDSLSTFILQYPNEVERREAILNLIRGIAPLNCTTLLISELTHSSITKRKYQIEEYVAHGAIILQRLLRTGGIIYVLMIEKMRGVNHDIQPRPFKITQNGIVVFPSEVVF
ncbi:MAG: ATPase domain-containing protein [Nitrososphaerota archaeon]|nr:AAA family ATPase [Aigarchaeota archaeon]MDW8076331.1 ATPase domain-containing protein [Nitrososphaerota archaeon]